ncbi:acid protease [Cerioporus squamosus]|nr:acid protease [Cerioporus squamosus]
MQLALSFSTLLASVLLLLSATDNAVHAVPLAKRGKSITLPLTRIHQNRGDVHPQILLQRHINRSQRRIARMKGVAPPSKRDLEANLSKRMFIPAGGRPGKQQKRYNRLGMPGAQAAVADEDDDDNEPKLGSLAKNKGLKAAAKKKGKGKGNGNANAGAANGTDTGAAAAAAATGLTPANTPTTANSLGLDIEAQDVGYIATIQMGTPATDFKILMDSGSADLWVGSETCVSEAGGGCGNHQFLGPTSSSSFVNTKKQFQVTYGTGEVSGDIVTDDISIAGLALSGHTFGVANTESADFSDDSVPFDGLMGLAQSTLSNQGVPTPVEALASAGLIDEAITSYKISRLADNKNDGEITFGALDTTKFDPASLVTFDNVATNGFWEGAMDAVTADGQDLGLTGRSAILDTGTTLIVAPPADAEAVHAAIPGAQSDGNGGFVIPCDTTTSVALSFGGTSFAIDSRDLIFAAADNTGTNCVSGISSGQIVDDTTWLVGDVFLKNAYFSTDVTKNTISLAKLV